MNLLNSFSFELPTKIEYGVGSTEKLADFVHELGARSVHEYRGKRWVVVRDEADWCVFPALCPHQLARLEDSELKDGAISCPWHGYRFDVRTGANLTGQSCVLGPRPSVVERAGELFLSA